MNKVKKNSLEWCVFGISSLLVLSVLAFLAYDAVTMTGGSATLEVRLGKTERRAKHFAIPITVYNRGHQTAETVQIEVALTKQEGGEERSSFEIPFVPAGASRRGFVTFESDPGSAAQLTARAAGYQIP